MTIVKIKRIKTFTKDGKIPKKDMKEDHIKQEPTYHTQNYIDAAVYLKHDETFEESDELSLEELYQSCTHPKRKSVS